MWRAAASPDPPEPEWKWGYLSLRPPLFYVAAPYLVLTLTGSDGTNVVHTTPVGLDAAGPSIRSCLSRSFTAFVGADVHRLTGVPHGLRGTAVTCCVGAMMVRGREGRKGAGAPPGARATAQWLWRAAAQPSTKRWPGTRRPCRPGRERRPRRNDARRGTPGSGPGKPCPWLGPCRSSSRSHGR